ncbi:serine/threonine-protein phosphatase 2A regulatory subunit B'' subunit alpha [Aplochiton taeniatus]
MAAAYRVVVSSVSCYNSVVVDRRAHTHAVHYCPGPCGALSRGLDCTVAHRGTCSELLAAPDHDHPLSAPTCNGGALERVGSSGSLYGGEDGPPWRGKKPPGGGTGCLALSSSSGSLKDITGEAINLASGKLKEFSFEKLRLSSGHVTFRKGRKVRPDSVSRRSTDLDIIYGHFSSASVSVANDENLPPFGKGPGPEERPLKGGACSLSSCSKAGAGSTGSLSSSGSGSLEQGLNTVASLYLSTLGEESLIARLLEKTRAEAGAGGEDIRACLDILLKCSEDLKKCTDIIKQCIRRKAPGAGGGPEDEGTSPETVYRAVMSRLSSYLKKLPLELEGIGGLGGRGGVALSGGHSDLAELVSSLHSLQHGPFSPFFGNEQPPRYEDVVLSPPSSLSPSLISPPSPKPAPASHTHSPPCSPMEALFIEEEADLTKAPDGSSRQGPRHTTPLPSDSRNGLVLPPPAPPGSSLPQAYPRPSSPLPATQMTPHRDEDIDKLLMDLESLSQSMSHVRDVEPPLPVKTRRREACQGASRSLQPPIQPSPQPHQLASQQATNSPTPRASQGVSTPPPRGEVPDPGQEEEEDGALLMRILESIESFAQELVESGAGSTGSSERSSGKEKEVMRLLQDNLSPMGRADTPPQPTHSPPQPTDAQEAPSLAPVPACPLLPVPLPSAPETPSSTPTAPPVAVAREAVSSDAVAGRDCGSTLLIQQTPEVIRVQFKTERKPGTPPPAPPPAPTTPTPRSSTPPPAPVLVTPPPPSVNLPRFYYPLGLPAPGPAANHDPAIAAIEAIFSDFEEEKADIYEMGKIAKACGFPLYWKAPMFNGAGGERTGFVSVHSFIATWRKLLHSCNDDASKFISLLAKPSCNYLEQEDLIPLLQDIVDTHPGLTFLKDAPEFHSRYITTVIQRIFYVVNRSWTGRITMTELRRSNFLQTLGLLEEEDDINQITDYFSYEHFYVIYCKFWELDADHDLYIDPKDLARYSDHASSNRIIQRLFSGAVTRGSSVQREGRMSYADFVWFLISEEDKKNLTSIEYWFRCMDVDGDGVLSMFELEFFYEEQCERMEGMGIEPLPFQDLLCQMLDLVKPECQGKITLSDLKRCRMAHIFYDTFFNLEKYLDHEQRDPFAVQKDIDSEGPEPSDWDKYAAEEYEILVAEETANEQMQDGSFDDDYESDELPVPGEMGGKPDKLVISDLSP